MAIGKWEKMHTDERQNLDLDKPRPRPPKSDKTHARIQVQNRRREYLQRHPSYLESKDNELADPVLYARLVKRFQTADERSAEVKAKGYGRTLEADLLRGENRLAGLPGSQRSQDSQPSTSPTEQDLEQDWRREATDKRDGLNLWHIFLTDRFILGRDNDFDYSVVDSSDEYDTLTRADEEEAWFDDEEPGLVNDNPDTSSTERGGDTGIQDF